MYTILWQYVVPDNARAEFARAYRASGEWAALFRRAPGYLGTELLEEAVGSMRYITIDRWSSKQAYDSFKAAFHDEYATLDARCEHLTAEAVFRNQPVAAACDRM